MRLHVLSPLSTSEKRQILSQIKEFVEQNEKAANDVLSDNPQLAQALLLIQMEFNLVKSQDIQALKIVCKGRTAFIICHPSSVKRMKRNRKKKSHDKTKSRNMNLKRICVSLNIVKCECV
eukprot:585829_1